MLSKVVHFHSFNESPLPEIIGFDTSFIIKYLVEKQDYHQKCKTFLKRLIEKQPIVVFSEILRAELWHANLKINLQKIHNTKDINIAVFLKKYPTIPRNLYTETEYINNLFNDLLGNFEYWLSIPITNKITDEALKLIHKYNLLGNDAIHMASMLYNEIYPVRNFVVFDEHIEDITDMAIWTHNGIPRYKKRHKIT